MSRIDRLIRDLLDVALLEAGNLTVQREPLSAAELVTEAMETQQSLASSAGHQLQLELERELPEICIDHHRLLQVFENLIGNAIKFTEAGGRITIGASSGQGYVLFRVTDTGPGIAPENLPHVFDRFWQAASSARRLARGSASRLRRASSKLTAGVFGSKVLWGGAPLSFSRYRRAGQKETERRAWCIDGMLVFLASLGQYAGMAVWRRARSNDNRARSAARRSDASQQIKTAGKRPRRPS